MMHVKLYQSLVDVGVKPESAAQTVDALEEYISMVTKNHLIEVVQPLQSKLDTIILTVKILTSGVFLMAAVFGILKALGKI
jgi:hypothetical protein